MTSIYITLAIYMAILFGLGLWCTNRNKNVTDFLLVGRRLTVVPATLTLVATLFGGACLTGTAQMAYDEGYIGVAYGILSGLVFIAPIFMINKMENFSKYSTITEYLEDRYKSKFLRAAASFLSLVALLGILGSQVSAITGFLRALGFPNITMAAILAMVVIIALTAMGGLLAVTITDCFQILVVIIGVTWVFVLAFADYGGFSGIASALDKIGDLPQSYSAVPSVGIAWLVLPFLMYVMIGQDGYQRLFACRDRKTATISAIAASIILALVTFMPPMLGIMARIGYPDLIGGDASASAFAVIAMDTLPSWGAGIVVAAALSAILSTADSLLSTATSHFVNDIYMLYFSKNEDPNGKKLLWVSRVFTVIGGAGAVIFSLAIPSIIDAAMYSYYIYTGGVFCPIVFGVFWKGTTKQGAVASMAVGAVFTLLSLFGVISLAGIPGEMFGGIVSALALVLVSLATAKR